MENQHVDWQEWQRLFADRSDRPLPELDVSTDYSKLPRSFARSLAIFQLGESGGGTIVEEVRRSNLSDINECYAEAIALFVEEEHRHANILAMCVRMLGGTLIRKNWTARLFVFARRLMGIRFKVLVLLAAEVVGICYYHLLANRLPNCQVRQMLLQLVDDEQLHLCFHCCFLRSQAPTAWRRAIFVLAWRMTMVTAAIVVLVDHRAALKDLGLDTKIVWRRWMSYSSLAERLVAAGDSAEIAPDSVLTST